MSTTSKSRPKILCIGANKAGSSSLHQFFLGNGLRSVHHGTMRRSTNLAQVFLRNASAARPLLHGLDHVDAFSDITYIDDHFYIDISVFLDRLALENPDAYFIYSYRDQEAWLQSRLKHHDGRFAKRFAKVYHIEETEVPEIWRNYHSTLRSRAREAVGRVGGKLLELEIGTDGPDRLVDFLRPNYDTSAEHWGRHNKGARLTLSGRLRQFRAQHSW